ncbi:GNAT family N-acetyltransferase [Sphingosinicella soli]|uniref:Ribosomal protein S18 acetylase RimI-like enzyme n=1 Tax=Sphingosinicella soli TaxID=333708 RepID=A0A7W7F5A5_9SPHN|nr:GNAT family N-acetyltransferase [Sphingosinicella soli]MBB4630499.1 ribosomal protein S18 acetylase RimI-like enzyme [Sphingosinicella soli]
MIVRPGRQADIAALAVVELSASEVFAGTHMAWAVGQTSAPEHFSAALSQNALWVAEIGGTPVGYLRGERLENSFYIDEISVSQSHQRRGIGRSLMEAALAEAAKRRFTAACLTTDRTIPWNAPYYERFGFRVLAADRTPPALARRLAMQPSPARRCVMWRDLCRSGTATG